MELMKYSFVVFATSLVFTLWDLYWYPKYESYSTAEVFMRYRVPIQITFQLVLYASVWYFFGVLYLLGCVIYWWFGGCDVDYYIIGRIIGRNYPRVSEVSGWYWLAWTPVGIILFVQHLWVYSQSLPFFTAWEKSRASVDISGFVVHCQRYMGIAIVVLLWFLS